MNNLYSVRALKFKPSAEGWEDYSHQVCPSRNAKNTNIWPAAQLDGQELDHFIERHSTIRAYGQQTFSDIYRDFSDQNDLFVLSDANARLITLYSSSEVMHTATRDMGLSSGTMLSESSCGSNAIALAIRYREAMISTSAERGASPFNNWATVAVPLLDANLKLMACIAIFNSGEGSLGEKLLLAKFVARELARFYTREAIPVPATTPAPAGTLSGRATDARAARLQAQPCPPPRGCEDRRQGDRRQMHRPTVPAQPAIKLTRRQHQVLVLFAQGKGYKEIARDIGITSYKTVEEHLDAVREKLQVSHRRECIHKAMALGLI